VILNKKGLVASALSSAAVEGAGTATVDVVDTDLKE